MNVRNDVSVPTDMVPAMTFSPPTHSTKPIAARNDRVMMPVERTLISTLSCASPSAEAEAASSFSISCAPAEKARTTRMPARFSSITRLRTDMRSCRSRQVSRSRNCETDENQPTMGTKLSAIRPSNGSVRISIVPPNPISTVSRTSRTRPVEKNCRAPSRSSRPSVIRSPEWTESWKPKLSRCTCS